MLTIIFINYGQPWLLRSIMFLFQGKFCLVDFTTSEPDDEVHSAIVPESWILDNSTSCPWPPNYKESLLRKPANPNWPKYTIILRGTYSKLRHCNFFLINELYNIFKKLIWFQMIMQPQELNFQKPRAAMRCLGLSGLLINPADSRQPTLRPKSLVKENLKVNNLPP